MRLARISTPDGERLGRVEHDEIVVLDVGDPVAILGGAPTRPTGATFGRDDVEYLAP